MKRIRTVVAAVTALAMLAALGGCIFISKGGHGHHHGGGGGGNHCRR